MLQKLKISRRQGPRSRYPKLAELCKAVQEAIGEPADKGWSKSCSLPIGTEDASVPLFSRLPLYSRAVLPSVETAVDALQSGQCWCPEDACLAYSSEKEQNLSVLYREGRREQVLQKLEILGQDLPQELRAMTPLSESKAFSQGHAPGSWHENCWQSFLVLVLAPLMLVAVQRSLKCSRF
eukprot:symbB.v1.2.009932.t1/scaffold640.1/size177612/15